MGSQFFRNCLPEERFSPIRLHSFKGSKWQVRDWDQRRTITVEAPTDEYDEDYICNALGEFIDDLAADAVLVHLSPDGALASSSSDVHNDTSWIPFYPLRIDFPPDTPTIRRVDLTEVDRLGRMVDLAAYSPSPNDTRLVVFKYNIIDINIPIFWHEANCVMRIPQHPNIVPFEALVVDVVNGIERVVGFALHYVPGGTVWEDKERVFKLKHFKQLLSVSCLSFFILCL